MLTEQQVRDTFAKYFKTEDNILSAAPFNSRNIWVHYTMEELESQLELLGTHNRTFSDMEKIHATEKMVIDRAVANGEYVLPTDFPIIGGPLSDHSK